MKVRYYRGAGILFWHLTNEGRLEVLLGLRSQGVKYPGVWSTFGGKASQGESPLVCAIREAAEETAGNRIDVFGEPAFVVDGRPLRVVGSFPVYRFHTYAVEVRQQVPGWPRKNWEHEECKWFMVENGLPENLHSAARKAILRLMKRLKEKTA